VDHPRTDERLEFIAPISDDMRRFLVSRGLIPDTAVVRRWIDWE
jgi:hypothetical protein